MMALIEYNCVYMCICMEFCIFGIQTTVTKDMIQHKWGYAIDYAIPTSSGCKNDHM